LAIRRPYADQRTETVVEMIEIQARC
jgi:hypothetical protein